MNDDGVSNLMALGLTAVVFMGVFGLVILQTYEPDPTDSGVNLNHGQNALDRTWRPYGGCTPPNVNDACLTTFGWFDPVGPNKMSLHFLDAIIEGGLAPQGPNAIDQSTIEAAYGSDYALRIRPLLAGQDLHFDRVAAVIDCDNHEATLKGILDPFIDDTDDQNQFECFDQLNSGKFQSSDFGSAELLVLTEIPSGQGQGVRENVAEALVDWHQDGRLLLFMEVGSEHSFLLDAVLNPTNASASSHLGLHDIQYPNSWNVDLPAFDGDVANSLSSSYMHSMSGLSISRAGALEGPLIVTTHTLAQAQSDPSLLENLLWRQGQPWFLETGAEDAEYQFERYGPWDHPTLGTIPIWVELGYA